MAILTSAFSYLGSYYSEANPSLQGRFFLVISCHYANTVTGQNIFTKGDKDSLALMDKQIYRLIGKATTLAAFVDPFRVLLCFHTHPARLRMAYRVRQGREFVTPPTGLSYTGSWVFLSRDTSLQFILFPFLSFLYQMDHLGEQDYTPNPILEKALDVLFLLHADHELNASSTTVLQTGSSLVDPYSAIA